MRMNTKDSFALFSMEYNKSDKHARSCISPGAIYPPLACPFMDRWALHLRICLIDFVASKSPYAHITRGRHILGCIVDYTYLLCVVHLSNLSISSWRNYLSDCLFL